MSKKPPKAKLTEAQQIQPGADIEVTCRACGHKYPLAFPVKCPECGEEYRPVKVKPEPEPPPLGIHVVEHIRANDQVGG